MESTAKKSDWSLVLKPKRNFFQLNLKELWKYRDLVVLFVRRDFVALYKQTILGPLWHVIQPVLTTIIFSVVFGRVAKLSTDGLPHLLFYMSGIVTWNYFAVCLVKTSNTFLTNIDIFAKVYFPRLVIPISIVISNLISFAIQFFVFLLILLYYKFFQGFDIPLNGLIAVFPLLVLLMATLGLGFGIIISSLTTKYRDLAFLVGFGVQLMMYASPVIYPLSSISSPKLKLLILSNPMTPIIETVRYSFLGAGSFEPVYLAYTTGFTLFVLMLGIFLFNRVEKNFTDTI